MSDDQLIEITLRLYPQVWGALLGILKKTMAWEACDPIRRQIEAVIPPEDDSLRASRPGPTPLSRARPHAHENRAPMVQERAAAGYDENDIR